MPLLRKVISGGQTGADEAGLVVGKRFGLATGGSIPKGFLTLKGNRPELGPMYGVEEDSSPDYAPRTYKNVQNSDGTVRLAGDFNSRGEICTKKAIDKCKKPHFDVDLSDPPPVDEFVSWLTTNNIGTLNVAGNAEQTYAGCFARAVNYLSSAFFRLGLEMRLSDDDIIRAIGLDPKAMILYTSSRELVDTLTIRQIGVRR